MGLEGDVVLGCGGTGRAGARPPGQSQPDEEQGNTPEDRPPHAPAVSAASYFGFADMLDGSVRIPHHIEA